MLDRDGLLFHIQGRWADPAALERHCFNRAGGEGDDVLDTDPHLATAVRDRGDVFYSVIAILPIGDALLAGLESRFPALESCEMPNEASIGGIIILGGGINPRLAGGKQIDDLNEAADRIRYAAALAHRYRDAPVLVSGGQAFDNGAGRSEADAMAGLLVDLGVQRSRILVENASRTTAENAVMSGGVDRSKNWLLVTSAFHMPRSVGSFRKAGFQIMAAPTDWRGSLNGSFLEFSASTNLAKFDLAAREFIGLAGYWATGKTDEFIPGMPAGCG